MQAYQSIHEPLQAPAFYAQRYNSSTPSFDSWPNGQKTIAMMLAALDDGVKNVTLALDSTGQTGNTIIILSADNGGTGSSSNWPLRGGKHSVYEGGCRGASFVAGPLLPARVRGTVNTQLSHAADWLPTLVGLAGGSTAGTLPLDGVDAWPAIVGRGKTTRNEVIYGHEAGAINFGLRMGKWKILRCFSGTPCASPGDHPSGYTSPGYGLTAPTPELHQAAALGQCNLTKDLCCPGGHGPTSHGSSPAACCAQCQATEECSLWTFNNWTGDAKCFLKLSDSRTSCPPTTKDAYCTTGTVGKAAITPGPPGPPPSPGPDPEGNPYELFDLHADPYEHNDVSAANPDGTPPHYHYLAGSAMSILMSAIHLPLPLSLTAVVKMMLARLEVLDATVVQKGEGDPACPRRTPKPWEPRIKLGLELEASNLTQWLPWC